ncbi:NAD(P)-binding protein [Penicillium taxi]|uniref:NAD(P)-binding protein n=1 Tax=Penicillium taxi TaxID=168475 RepID=UPI0025450318|nr:NAD(P)-binding protein [Penicillium taxi]KAJ5899946.1 NAD(P)-binding protein [Penicillium taxi]
MGVQFSQVFPPCPTFTVDNLPDLSNKAIIITGAASGIGLELAKILHRKGAKIYMMGRSEEKAKEAINAIQAANAGTSGELVFLPLHLDNLTSIKDSVQAFQEKESKLDLLVNNAGVSQPPRGSVSKQGFELQLATNCLGPFFLTRLLLPLLEVSASNSSPGSTRVIWTSSQSVEFSPLPEVIVMAHLTNPPKDQIANYNASKLGNWCLAAEMARRYGGREILSVAQNPGAANTNLLRNSRLMKFFSRPLLHSPVLAAHTVLYASFSPDISLDNHDTAYVIPWGRLHPGVAENLKRTVEREGNGGSGRAKEFWEFCEQETTEYA